MSYGAKEGAIILRSLAQSAESVFEGDSMKWWRLLTFVVVAFGACQDHEPADPTGGDGQDGTVKLAGGVQKGPFVLGSSMTVSLLDGQANPTGVTFLTETLNDKGEFSLTLTAPSFVRIEGEGYYYNEVTGALSGASLTLRALHVTDAPGEAQAFVNVVTHLTALRLKKLLLDGASFSAAREQAEDELLLALAITPPSFDPGADGVAMNILGGDSAANAYLLGVSAVLAQAGASDAGIQELANLIATDLEGDGLIGASNYDKITAALLALDPDAIMANLAQRLDEVGSTEQVPNLHAVLDQDRDGIANADDNCPTTANPDQADGDGDGHGDVCDSCPTVACPGDVDCTPAEEASTYLCGNRCDFPPAFENPSCDVGEVCVEAGELLTNGGVTVHHVCAEPCDPLNPACPAETECRAVSNAEFSSEDYFFACVGTFTAPQLGEGDPCQPPSEQGHIHDCGPGLACLYDFWQLCGSTSCCFAVCQLGASGCSAGETCTETPALEYYVTGLGMCLPDPL